ncbi:MAG: glycosyltransferase [Rhodothermales bacterium]
MTLLIVALHAAMLVVFAANMVYLRRQKEAGVPAASLPFVSVLIPARNEAANLTRLLPGLLAQDYPRLEVIVYDDGSTDATPDVLRAHASDRLRTLRGEGPPPGWMGKVHALHQAARSAAGEVFLFLDADTEWLDAKALARLIQRYLAIPEPGVLTVLPHFRGGGLLLVSIVPNAMLMGLPWPLVRRLASPALGAVNGQCWIISRDLYREHEPHAAVADEILEDVMIGRYLKRRGVTPSIVDATGELAVYMYGSLAEARAGFRKNAYLLFGGTPGRFIPLFVFFAITYTVAPLVAWPLLGLVYLNKTLTDRRSRLPVWVSLFAPLSYVLASIVQIDSALAHRSGRVQWKGRTV